MIHSVLYVGFYGNAPEFVQFSVSFRPEPRLSIMACFAKFETAPPPPLNS